METFEMFLWIFNSKNGMNSLFVPIDYIDCKF